MADCVLTSLCLLLVLEHADVAYAVYFRGDSAFVVHSSRLSDHLSLGLGVLDPSLLLLDYGVAHLEVTPVQLIFVLLVIVVKNGVFVVLS